MTISTPEKKKLKEAQRPTTKSGSKTKAKRKLKAKKWNTKNQERFYIVCAANTLNSAPGEIREQCGTCKEWAHEVCTDDKKKTTFVINLVNNFAVLCVHMTFYDFLHSLTVLFF